MSSQTPSIFRAQVRGELHLGCGHPTFASCCLTTREWLARWEKNAKPGEPAPDVWIERIDTDRHGRRHYERVAQLSGKRGA